ncbi:MAG: 2'-5' RNA ligase family protein [Nitrososphaerales archaeon]
MNVIPVADYWNQILESRDEAYLGLIFRLPPRLWLPLKRVQDELKGTDPNQLYSQPNTFHITVKGLGYLERTMDQLRYEKAMKKIGEIITDFRPFTVNIKGLGAFPTSIYAGVEDPTSQLSMINKRISEELMGEVEQSKYDGDAYIPHVTLATFNNREVAGLLKKLGSPELKEFDFGQCVVFEVEAVEVNLLLALGPEETQGSAFSCVRSFHLG